MLNKRTKSMYPHPFSKAYWIDAAKEMKSVKMLIIASLMIALRVALKNIAIPIAPSLSIGIAAPLVNAVGAMIFGPVVALFAACVSDTISAVLFSGGAQYFFPFIFVEIASSIIFALFFYRAKITTMKIIVSRFCINLFVNIMLNSSIMMLYYKVVLGKPYQGLIVPAILKNLFMFPIEAFILVLFMSVVIPITYKMNLTFDTKYEKIVFKAKHVFILFVMFIVGAVSTTAYLFYHYDNTSLSASYSQQERYAANTMMLDIVKQKTNAYDEKTLVTTVESAYRKFGKGYVEYNVAIYVVDDNAIKEYDKTLEEIRALSKSKAAKVEQDGVMKRVATVKIFIDKKDNVIEYRQE